MRVKEEVMVIEQTVKIYIAEDGKVFQYEHECRDYETKLHYSDKVKEAEKLRIEKFDQLTPIMYNNYLNNDNVFMWYKVESEKDLNTLKAAYDRLYDFDIKAYPELVCVESLYEPYEDEEAYHYTLTECKSITESFWEQMGYKVTLEKIES